MNPLRRQLRVAAIGIAATALATTALTACSTADANTDQLRLGFFPNLTHATALVGTKEGFYAKSLGNTELKTQTFNAGPAAVEALLAGSLDATYIGPNPSINAFVQSKGDAVRIIAGATSGGASLVVQPDIASAADLKGKTLASPQLGNTQDVALRYWLEQQGYKTSKTGTADVTVAPAENATTLQLFKDKKIAGAWVPEPWASRLVLEGGGKVLVDERTQWPAGQFVTTNLLVRTKYLEEHPDRVEALLEGQVATNAWIVKNPAKAQTDIQAQLKELAGKQLAPGVLARAWTQLRLTDNPLASTLQESADHAVSVGVTKEADLKGIYDLTLLNKVLKSVGQPAVSAGGLGKA